jgi:hypothetical protein
MLPPEERARITAHLADCESCYEIFAGAVHFQQDEPQGQAAVKEGKVVPFRSRKEGDAGSRKPWWIGAAAAALLAVGVGFVEYPILFSSKLSTAGLGSKPIPEQSFYRYARFRGGDLQSSLADDAPKFMIGVLLTDIRLDRQQGNIDAERLAEIGRKLKKVSFADTEAQAVLDRAEKLRSGGTAAKDEAAKSLPAQEDAIEELLDSPPYKLGTWSEAGRLAAVTRTPAFFSSRGNERFLAKLLQEPISREEGVAEPLAAIKAITDRGVREADFSPLAQHFTEIIRHYDI